MINEKVIEQEEQLSGQKSSEKSSESVIIEKDKYREMCRKNGRVEVKIHVDHPKKTYRKTMFVPGPNRLLSLHRIITDDLKLNSTEGIFLFIRKQKIIQMRSTFKELHEKYANGDGVLQIHAAPLQQF